MCITSYYTITHNILLHYIIYSCSNDWKDICLLQYCNKLGKAEQKIMSNCVGSEYSQKLYRLSDSILWQTWKSLEIMTLVSVDLTSTGHRLLDHNSIYPYGLNPCPDTVKTEKQSHSSPVLKLKTNQSIDRSNKHKFSNVTIYFRLRKYLKSSVC